MYRLMPIGTLAALLLGACSEPGSKVPATETLCAAEALHLARTAESRADEDALRERSSIFFRKLPAPEQQRSWNEVDRLADRRGPRPLVAASACEALLTAQDRRELAARTTAEIKDHDTNGDGR